METGCSPTNSGQAAAEGVAFFGGSGHAAAGLEDLLGSVPGAVLDLRTGQAAAASELALGLSVMAAASSDLAEGLDAVLTLAKRAA
jgi:hypothetical protein